MSTTSRRVHRKARVAGLLVLTVTALVAGCASVPTSGPVRSGGGDGDRRAAAGIDVRAGAPRPGAQPVSIVNDFIDAMATSTDIARQYLTQAAAATWPAKPGITVYDGSDASLKKLPNQSVLLDARPVATLDDRGTWRNAVPGPPIHMDFGLVREKNEWRISQPPPQLQVPLDQLRNVYAPRSLYFFTAPKPDVLVQDLVYLPVLASAGQDATLMVRALVAGPTAILGAAAETAVPEATEVVSVPVDADGIATVAFNDGIAGLDPELRVRLAAQLAWTLSQVPGVRSLKVTMNGAPYEIESTTEPQDIAHWQNLYSQLGRERGRLYLLDGGGKIFAVDDVEAVLNSAAATTPLDVLPRKPHESIAIDIDAKTIAVFTGDNVMTGSLTKPDATFKAVGTYGDVLPMSFDKDGSLWIVDHPDQARIQMRPAEGSKTIDVQAGSLTGRHLKALRVSRDGVRVVAILDDQGHDKLVLGTITRNEHSAVISGAHTVPVDFTRLLDVGWSGPTKLTLVGAKGNGPSQLEELNVDGSEQAPIPAGTVESKDGPVTFDPVGVAVSPDKDSLLLVRNRTGEVLVQDRDLSWRLLVRNGTPVYAS